MVMQQQAAASLRARGAIPSPMRKLAPLAEAAAAEGAHIYHLNIGQPDIEMPDSVLQSIRNFDSHVLPYAPSHGLSETLDAWRAYYANLGIEFERSELLVTCGGSEAVLFTLMAVADPGDEVVVFEPTYANYFGFAHMASVNLVPVAARPEDGYHLPPTAEIEERVTPRTRAICFSSPGNPTGAVYSYEELQRLNTIASRHDLFLIADETYREIVFEGPRDMSTMKVEGAAPRTIIVDSVSKRFSLTGARIGCIASRNAEVMNGVLRFAQARLSAPTLEQRAIIPLLRNSRGYTDHLAATYAKRRDVVLRALERMPGAFAKRPEGAFYVLAGLPVEDGEDFTRWLLTDFRMDGETVMVAPGAGFYLSEGMGKSEVRIAFVLGEAGLGRAMDILSEGLRVYPERRN